MAVKKRKAAVGGTLWLDKGGHGFLGRGRVELLRRIAETGSISAAAKAMGMSYKAAWDAVDAMNNLADEPLVVRTTGGRHGGGTTLTAHGRRTVELFQVIAGEYDGFLKRMSEGVSDFERFFDLMRRFALKTTARNQFQGRIGELVRGAVNAEVVVELTGRDRLVAIVTNEGADCLGLAQGMEVYALFRESSVIVVREDCEVKTSARNRLCGTVVRCQEGAVNGEVAIQLDGGRAMTAIITNESIHRLGLKEGARACGLIKASDVILATNG